MILRETLLELKAAVGNAKSGGEHFIEIPVESRNTDGDNQFLFFLKPELTDAEDHFGVICDFIFQNLERFKMEVESISVVSGEYLAKYDIISDHYGVIDAAAKNPLETITEAMWESFEAHFDKKRDEVKVIGGIPYLTAHPELDSEELSRLWLNRGYFRLGGGTYTQYVPDEDLYLVNGFYPRMLYHFTRNASCIVSVVLRTSTGWKVARRDLVGATAPTEAEPGSIRNGLLVGQHEFGLPEISPNLNGVHLSAGPVEGLVELMRFTTNRLGGGHVASVGDFHFGRMLMEHFDEARIRSIMDNPMANHSTGVASIFDLTEEVNSLDAVEILRSVYS